MGTDDSGVAMASSKRGIILGSLAAGHAVCHTFDLGIPLLLTAIARSLGLGTVETAGLLAMRQAGSSITSLAGGPIVDMLKPYWGLILLGCMLSQVFSFTIVGLSPNYIVLLGVFLLVSMPGDLWHLPSAAAISQLFPDKRGFAMSIHGFGSNLGNLLGPVIAGGLLAVSVIGWKDVFFIYAGAALLASAFVWLSLGKLGSGGRAEPVTGLLARFKNAIWLLKRPVVSLLILAALLRGIGLTALFDWTPFYLRDTLGLGLMQSGVYFALLTGMGIVSAPIMGIVSDRLGRNAVLIPGLVLSSVFTFLVVLVGDSFWLLPVMVGIGLFSFALHQIIQAAVLDIVGQGNEATAIGMLFGINGTIGVGAPFIASGIIEHLGGYGSIFYYGGMLSAVSALAVLITCLPKARPAIVS
ncbi:MAG: MFS transporter [Chloroflexota bacterium]|nr:MFS transporter [Chloroflexota bacterium]